MDQFAQEIAGALKATIKAHGPITEDQVASATKRIAHALREEMKRERDRMAMTSHREWTDHEQTHAEPHGMTDSQR